jgi:hypothetical protein
MWRLGFLPLEWSGALDSDQIWGELGFFFLLSLLQWMEEGVGKKTTISFNKVSFVGHLIFCWRVILNALLAGLSGEGRMCSGRRCCAAS